MSGRWLRNLFSLILQIAVAVLLVISVHFLVRIFFLPEWTEYQKDRIGTETGLFLFALSTGAALVLIGSIKEFRAVGVGIVLGGLLTLADGYYCYWRSGYIQNWISLFSSVILIVLLGIVAYRRLAKHRKIKPSE